MSEYDDREKWSDANLITAYVGALIEVKTPDALFIREAILRRMSPETQPGVHNVEEYYKEDEFDYIITIDNGVKYEYRLRGNGEYSIQELIGIIVSHTKLSEVSCERVIEEPQPEAQKEIELLPCPFCGGKAIWDKTETCKHDIYNITCGNDECPVSSITTVDTLNDVIVTGKQIGRAHV